MNMKIDINRASQVLTGLERQKSKLNTYAFKVSGCIGKYPAGGKAGAAIARSLRAAASGITDESTAVQNMYNGLNTSLNLYRTCESKLAGQDIHEKIFISDQAEQYIATGESGLKDLQDRDGTGGLEGSLLSGSAAVSGSVLGINLGMSAEGELIGGSVEATGKAVWKPDKGEAGLEASVVAEGHLAQGKLEGSVGCSKLGLQATVGTASVTGAVGATLFKDGKLSPQLTAKAKAEAAAAKGEISSQTGTDNFNMHAKASGTLLGAEAEAAGGVGKITYKDSTGNTVSGYGVQGKVSAEAYAAQGTLSGGFTLFGIKIDASITGKAGGAGIDAGGSVTTGGISGEIGAGLGLGLGLKLNIDWSNFLL